MLTKTDYTVDHILLQEAAASLPETELKLTINQPTGDFFYDPWEIKPEYKGTVWEQILSTLPITVGEARIIILGFGTCYQSHGDIDDRYHLNVTSQYSYLINLDEDKMYPLHPDGIWYSMDAGPRHSAANFGYIRRIQLVVRKLLDKNNLVNPVSVKISYIGSKKETARFVFDDAISPWLNRSNKKGILTDFSFAHNDVRFKLEKTNLIELENILPQDFKIEFL